jgi:Asp-tRNA(Asn)/Glu-tRNA(Gln) amidotransferase C subunit
MKYSCPSGVIKVCSATTNDCDWKLRTLKDLKIYRQGMEKTAKHLERNADYYDQSAELSPHDAENLRNKAKSIRRDARKAREKGKKCRGPVSFET